MLVFFIYISWTILYLILILLFKLLFLNKLINNKSKLKTSLLIWFYNEHLLFCKNSINSQEIRNLSIIRYLKYPTLNLIHNKINYVFFKPSNKKLTFKKNYEIYSYLVNNNLKLNLNFISYSNILVYSVIQNILINNILFNSYNIIYYNTFKNSITEKLANIKLVVIRTKKTNINIITNNVLLGCNRLLNITKYKNLLSSLNYNSVLLNSKLLNKLYNSIVISFSASNIIKYLSDRSISKSTILFLRKNKIFNKSRYSRNRQTYRTGAYWCLYVNIIAVIAFYFWFYNFTINFGYVWWLLYIFILSFFLFKSIKFNFYNIRTLCKEFMLSLQWFYLLNIIVLRQLILKISTGLTRFKINLIIKVFVKTIYNLNLFKYIFTTLNNLNDWFFDKLTK